jgi:hypothetical protein
MLRLAVLLAAVLGGWAATAGAVVAWDVAVVEPAWRDRVVTVLTAVAAAAGAAVALLARARPTAAADAGVAAAGVLLGAAGTAALHGTRWGWYGLYSDSASARRWPPATPRRPRLVDYGYRDLPAYYPPALGLAAGRLAAVTDLAGWEAVKPVQLLVGVLVPVAAYLLWRPVVGALPRSRRRRARAGLDRPPAEARRVAGAQLPAAVVAADRARRPGPGRRRWPVLAARVVLGAAAARPHLLVPAVRPGDAAGAGLGRRPAPPGPPAATAAGAGRRHRRGGLAVSAVSWVPVVAARLRCRGLPAAALLLPRRHVPPVPSPSSRPRCRRGRSVWLGVGRRPPAAPPRRRRCARRSPGLALAGCLLTLALGELAARADVGFLAFKTQDAVLTVLLAAGVLGAADWLRGCRRRGCTPRRAVLVGAAAASAGTTSPTSGRPAAPALVAHTTRYPTAACRRRPSAEPYVRTLFVDPRDPSVAEVVFFFFFFFL